MNRVSDVHFERGFSFCGTLAEKGEEEAQPKLAMGRVAMRIGGM